MQQPQPQQQQQQPQSAEAATAMGWPGDSGVVLGQFMECTLFGAVPRERAEELVGRLRLLCEAHSERRQEIRESVFRARDPRNWSQAEVALWIVQRIGREAAAPLVNTPERRLTGPQLLKCGAAEFVRRGVAATDADTLAHAVAELARTFPEPQQQQQQPPSLSSGGGLGFDGEVRLRCDMLAGRRTLRLVSDIVKAERLGVDARTVIQLDVPSDGGDVAYALENAGMAHAFDWQRSGRSFFHHSGVCAALFEVRRIAASAQHQQQQSELLAANLVVELRINATMQTVRQAAEHLLAFAASLAPYEFFATSPGSL